MSRIKIELPSNFHFTTEIIIRITDINYGGHVGNDSILSIIHEARMQFLIKFGYTEMNVEGVGLIMSDAGIEFKSELFYGETVVVDICLTNISKVSFDLFYRLLKKDSIGALVAIAKTGMVCYNYSTKKITPVPEKLKNMFIDKQYI